MELLPHVAYFTFRINDTLQLLQGSNVWPMQIEASKVHYCSPAAMHAGKKNMQAKTTKLRTDL
jgi:hypothetical protein